jgi:hypothetical protein
MPDSIAIVCTVNELADHATATTRLFAANISAGVTVNPALPLAQSTQNLLSPWLWTLNGPLQLYVQRGTAPVAGVTAQAITPFPVNPTDPAYMLLTARMKQELQNAVDLTTQLATTPNPVDLLLWNPSDPGASSASQENGQGQAIQPWPLLLSHASTYPAPLPHLLNLVLFFTLDATLLNTGDVLFVAPVFSISGVSYKPQNASSPVVVPPKSGMTGTVSPGYSWTYLPASGTNPFPDLAVYQNGLTIQAKYIPRPPASGPARIDLQSMWIAATQEDGNEDWRSTLEQRAADSFDLAQKIVDAFRGNSKPPYTPTSAPTPDTLEQLRITVLSLLRDTADFGLRRLPDGFSTFRYVVDRAVRANGATFDIGAAEKSLAATDATITVQSWQNTLQQFLMQSSTSTADAWALAFQDVHTWNTLKPQPEPQTLGRLLDTLDALQTKLADDATLGQWLLSSWNNNLTWTIGAFVENQINQLSTSHTLRKRMLQANLGGQSSSLAIWKEITKIDPTSALKERAQINGNISNVLTSYYHMRIGDNPSADPSLVAEYADRKPRLAPASSANPLPLPPDMIAYLAQAIPNLAASAANNLFPPDDTSGANPVPVVQVAGKDHPVLLQVRTSAPLPDARDPLRGIAGVCVLAKENVNGTYWSCLNASSVAVVDPANPANPKLVSNGYFVPQRLTMRNGLLQAAVSYNNDPLISPSPKNAAAKDITRQTTANANYQPLFQFLYQPNVANLTNPNTVDAWARIAGLKYGCQYQFVSFAVHNSGALPIALTDPSISGYPLVPKAPQNFTLPTVATTVSVTYKRRIPVGGPRWQPQWVAGSDEDGDLSQSSLPAFPDTVNPFARELDPSLSTGANGKTLPLLLLWPPAVTPTDPKLDPSKFSFSIRPPAIHLDSWDRWIRPAGPSNPAPNPLDNLRKAVFADVFRASPKGTAADLPGSVAAKTASSTHAQDTSLNDRAVTAFWFRLELLPTPNPPVVIDYPIDLSLTYSDVGATPIFNDGFKQVQANCVPVQVVTGASGSTALIAGNASQITVTVPAGTVWKFSIASAINNKTDTARFDAITGNPLFDTKAGTTPSGNTVVQVLKPMQMLIEAAKSASITTEAAWRAFNPAFSGSTLSVSLTAPAGGDWPLVRRVDVTRQVWRWLGRPYNTKPFPFIAKAGFNNVTVIVDPTKPSQLPDPDMSHALQWEAESFAGRVDGDSTVSTSKVHFLQGSTTPTTVTVYTADLSTDLRALYFRFGLRIYSRYDGLPNFTPFTAGTNSYASIAAKIAFKNAGSHDGYTTWKRIFVPSRVPASAKVSKPKILISIPLTTALDAKGYPITEGYTRPSGDQLIPSTPRTDLIVIANEPWHQTAGLAEELTASIELTTNPDRTIRSQIGPDPILSGAALDPTLAQTFQTSSGSSVTSAQSVGTPIGATFDEVTDAPLFANTCFHLRLPQNPDSSDKLAGSLDWVMAKLQFSRTINTAMYDPTLGAPPQSPLTEGTWVELLPSSAHFNSGAGPVAVNDLVFQTGTGVTLSTNANPTAAITLQPSAGSGNQLELWALLMQNIADAAGQPGEVYVGLVCISGSSVNLTVTPPNLAQADHLYLLEVQKTIDAKAVEAKHPPVNWLDRLFPSATSMSPANAAYRVVRLSNKINRYVLS